MTLKRGPSLSLSLSLSLLWAQKVLLQVTRRNLQHARIQQKREDIRHVREQLLDALHSNDRREVWRLTRVIAGNKLGIRKRRYAIPVPLRPIAAEWSSHLAQPGPAGGCMAQELWQGPPHQLQAFWDVRRVLAPAQHHLASDTQCQEDLEGVRQRLRATSALTAVPPWSAPRLFWTFLLGAKSQHPSQPFCALFRQLCFLIRSTRSVPQQWLTAMAALLPKYNGKVGCNSIRLVHVLDDIGKSFFAYIWRKAHHTYDDHSLGFVPHRRREEAQVVVQVAVWRRHQVEYSSISLYRDLANVFPSMDRTRLDNAVLRDIQGSDAELLIQRHSASLIIFSAKPDHWLCVQPMVGDAQGDSCAPQKFIQSFDPLHEEQQDQDRTLLNSISLIFEDPTSKQQVTADHVRFADDCTEIRACTSLEGAFKAIDTMNTNFDAAIHTARIAQNMSKQQMLTRFTGKGSAHACSKLPALLHNFGHKWRAEVKHLGSYFHFTGTSSHEVDRRIAESKKAWRSLGRFWYSPSIPLSLRFQVFLALPLATLLSALDAYCLQNADIQKPERVQVRQLRALLHGQTWGLSNIALRAKLHCPTVRSRLQARRVAWLQKIGLEPHHHRFFSRHYFRHFFKRSTSTMSPDPLRHQQPMAPSVLA